MFARSIHSRFARPSALRWQWLLLLVSFWFAQVHGVVHEIGHLADAVHAERQLAAPAAQFCAECLGLAQAGAAPLSAPPAHVILEPAHQSPDHPVSASAAEALVLAYRSRAPPPALI